MEYSERIVFNPYDHCEYTCDLTIWYERAVKEAA